MIRIQEKDIERNFGPTFKYLSDGRMLRGKGEEGYVNMIVGLHIDDHNRELSIDITDESLDKGGDFSTVSLTKPEVRKLIDFLEERYLEMRDIDDDEVMCRAIQAYIDEDVDLDTARYVACMISVEDVANLNAEELSRRTSVDGVFLKTEIWEKIIRGAKKVKSK